MEIKFRFISYGSEDWKQAVKLREAILRISIGQTFSTAELEEERNHVHLVGLLNHKVIATASLVIDGYGCKMQRVAVDQSLQSQSIGSKMVNFIEEYLKEHNCEKVYCHARNTAVQFYLNNEYTIEGDYFDEDGIPHVKMVKNISQSLGNAQ